MWCHRRLAAPLSLTAFSLPPTPILTPPPSSCIINGQKAIPFCAVTGLRYCFFLSPTFVVLISKICLSSCFFWLCNCLFFSTIALLRSQKMKRAREREQRPGWRVGDWRSEGEKSAGWVNWFYFVTERKLALHKNPFQCGKKGAPKELSKKGWREG